MNPDNHSQMCCLGVLTKLFPEIVINTDNEGACIINGKNLKYDPFDEMGVHDNIYSLASINDESYIEGVRDYSKVIPIIYSIKTID